jgi:hypothetical protein
LKKAKTVAIEPKELNQVTSPAPENKDVTGVRLLFQDGLYPGAESMKAASHVGHPCGEPDPRACPQLDHRARLSKSRLISLLRVPQ